MLHRALCLKLWSILHELALCNCAQEQQSDKRTLTLPEPRLVDPYEPPRDFLHPNFDDFNAGHGDRGIPLVF